MKLLNDISLIDRGKWEELVHNSSVATVFQTPDMCDFYTSTGLFDLKVIGVEEDARLKGVVVCTILAEGKGLKKRFSSRAVINGGPLLDDDISPETLARLLQYVVSELKHECIFIETRNFNDYSHWRDVFVRNGFSYQPHYNFHVDTSSLERLDGNIGKSRRRDIKYTLREGAEAVEASTQDEIDAFYGILSALYKDKVKRPLFPLSFFHQLKNKSFTYLVVVKFHDEVVGGSLCVALESRTMYEWFVCGRDHEWRNVHPSELATYEAMRLAVAHGCTCFDMMGAGEPGKAYGVRDFKAHFGGVLVEHGRFLHVNRRLVYSLGKIYVNLKSKP